MRAAASLAINSTGADAAVAVGALLRARFIRILDDGLGANGMMMGVFPAGVASIASYVMYSVALDATSPLPKDETELQNLGLALLPSEVSLMVVATGGEAALISRVFAPGWYYCRQVSAGATAKRADVYPVALNSFTLP